jgi:hypothetical protein
MKIIDKTKIKDQIKARVCTRRNTYRKTRLVWSRKKVFR